METPQNHQPPTWPLKILRWMIKDEYLEEIEGDMEEIFLDNLEVYPPEKARRLYAIDTLKLLRPIVLKNIFPQNLSLNTSMFRHNLLITYRSFMRNKSSFLINLFGLSTGLACVLLIALWVNDELNVDKFHEKDARIYQVLENVNQSDYMITRATTSGRTAKALADEMPEVELATNTTYTGFYQLSVEDKRLSAEGIYVGADYLNIFSYNLIQGDPDQALSTKESIVITESLALNLFGTTKDVVGKMIEWEEEKSFQISGILEDVPQNSSFQFDFLLTFDEFWDQNEWVRNWFNTMPRTYVLMVEGADPEAFSDKIHDLVLDKTEGRAAHRFPFIAKFSDRYLYGKYENGAQSGGRIEYVKLFSIVAGFILLIACINFMNLATARASRRMKEIGVKKTIGARRGNLISQYLSESLLMTAISLGLALVMVGLFLPQFNLITEKQLTLDLNLEIIAVLVGVLIITGLIAGSYPALYLSAIKPTVILKSKMNDLGGELWARKGLVVFQFAMSIILISTVVIVYKQIEFTQNQNLGYDQENILMVDGTGELDESSNRETFLTEVRNLSSVSKAASTGHNLVGHNGGTYGVEWPGKDPEDRTEFERFAIDYETLDLLGVEFVEGRNLSREFGGDSARILFNEAAIKYMGIEDPIGKKVNLWGNEMEIAGVMKDFHFNSFHEEVKPVFCWINTWHSNLMLIKIKPGEEQNAIAQLEELHKEFNPEFPFGYNFLDEDYQKLYEAEQRVSVLARYFAGLAILISCLGLFGLAAFTAERRMKEIGIRKILGSSVWNIILLLSREFTFLVIISIVIALPVSYFFGSNWLEGFRL